MTNTVFTTLKDFALETDRIILNEDGTIDYLVGPEGNEEIWMIHGPKYPKAKELPLILGTRPSDSPKGRMRSAKYGNTLTVLKEDPSGEQVLTVSDYGNELFDELEKLGLVDSNTHSRLKLAISLWQKAYNHCTDCLDPEDCAATYRKVNNICDYCKGDPRGVPFTYVKEPGSSRRVPVYRPCPKCNSQQ